MPGEWPTKIARRSAFSRSDWSTVFALIQRPRPRESVASEAVCRCQPRRPAVYINFRSMTVPYPGPVAMTGIATTLTWPVGVTWTAWHYLWRILPVWRSEVSGTRAEDEPPPIPAGVETEGLQQPEDGSGPLFH